MPARKPRPAAPGSQRDIAAMIRVDHAGEYGAVRIYQGQLLVLSHKNQQSEAVEAIRHMAEQEQSHLQAFDTLINVRGVRPTALEPLWRLAGFALGAATAALGEKAALACTAAVEDVIDAHYAGQIAALGETDPVLTAQIRSFRADEAAHRQLALDKGAEQAPGYRLLSSAIKSACRIAIKLSERI